MIRTPAQQTVETRERMRGGQGTVTLRHFFNPADFAAPVRLCARLEIPPGAGIGPHAHAGEDEVYVILKGEGLLDDGRQRTLLKAGDAVLTGRGDSHAITNSGSETLEIAAFIACYP